MVCRRPACLLVLLCLLPACATQAPRDTTGQGWAAHSERTQALGHWTASGKIALRSADASESASLVWQQRNDHAHLQLSGPLGVGATTIDSDGRQLKVQRGEEQQILDISSPQAIVLNTGWDLPLRALPHWLKGVPSPDHEIQELVLDPETGKLSLLRQDDWRIQYQDYGQFQDFTLPTRLQIQRNDIRARILIRQWQGLSS